MTPDRPFIVALGGGIASGKTTVSDRFADLGVPVIDTDQIARDLVTPGAPALEQLVAAFGNEILTPQGQLDRTRMRSEIFSDPTRRRRLEAIVHPLIEAETRHRLQALPATPYAIVVVPLLLDSALRHDADRIVVVDCDPATQLERLIHRDDIDTELAQRMIAAQPARERLLASADDVIDNHGDPAALQTRVRELHQTYIRQSTEHARAN